MAEKYKPCGRIEYNGMVFTPQQLLELYNNNKLIAKVTVRTIAAKEPELAEKVKAEFAAAGLEIPRGLLP